MTATIKMKPVIGWREWMSLPDLGIEHIKVKVDTGARTSALHAFIVEPFKNADADWVRFSMHPIQLNNDFIIECQAPVKDKRIVTDSGGHREERYVIETTLQLGVHRWNAEITLTDRDSMKFRMLLGRTAIARQFVIDPSRSYVIGKKPR